MPAATQTIMNIILSAARQTQVGNGPSASSSSQPSLAQAQSSSGISSAPPPASQTAATQTVPQGTGQAPPPAPMLQLANPVLQTAAPAPHPNHAAPHHHLPTNMARVFKLQFDARRIICCSQTSIIVGWDFANGDEQIIEASRFFAPIE